MKIAIEMGPKSNEGVSCQMVSPRHPVPARIDIPGEVDEIEKMTDHIVGGAGLEDSTHHHLKSRRGLDQAGS